jgi:hypothetical protein
VLLLNECLLLFISLSTQSGNFWIYPRIYTFSKCVLFNMSLDFLLLASSTALEPTQPPIQGLTGALSLRVKRPEHEADHSPPSSAEAKECMELYLHYPNTPSMRDAQLRHRDNFTFYLYLYAANLIVPQIS